MIEKPLCNIINKDIDNFNVTDNTKVPTIRPLHQKKHKQGFPQTSPVDIASCT